MIKLMIDMRLNRRKFVAGTGAALGAAGLGSKVGADDTVPVEIATVYPVEDVVVLENVGDEEVDLGGYEMHWGMNLDQNQIDEFDSGITIGPGQQLSVWTGFQSTQIDDVEADVQVADHDNGRINAEEPNTLGLVAPSGDVVDRTDDTVADDPAYDAGEYEDRDEEDTADDEGDEPVPQDVEFEYEYDADIRDREDVDLESMLEMRSAEQYKNEERQDRCFVEVEAENLTDDTEINVYYAALVEDVGSLDSAGVIEPGETISVRLSLHGCPDDPEEGVVSAWASDMWVDGEEDEADPDADPEEEPDDDAEGAEPKDDDEEADGDEEPADGKADDETDSEKDDDCPDDEDEAKDEKKSKDEDCPEEDPEPEPEPEDDDC